ncbi:hypothetical protein BDB01DRAFT_802690 [Pilobolus umbonatus]|nr:hypothetical protein BDB01DRAFT_802690 [Pilobolus umbonatus]
MIKLNQIFKKSAHEDLDIMRNPYYTTEPRINQMHNKIDSLIHAMHLFEYKNRHPPMPIIGPLPIKANGAIVVHRPNQSPSETSSLFSSPDDDEEEEEEEADIQCLPNSLDNLYTKEDRVELVHQENKRLRQQLLIEREHYEQWREEREESRLVLEKILQENNQLKRINDKLHKLICNPLSYPEDGVNRRKSTGYLLSSVINQCHTGQPEETKVSYEYKIQILLNELDAMETEQGQLQDILCRIKQDHNRLERALVSKEDLIKQLSYDLQYEKAGERD